MKNNKTRIKSNLRPSLKSVAIISILPIIWFFLMLLPEAIRNTLKLSIYSPKLWQFLTSSFIHLNTNHLISNVISYLGFVLPTLFLISNTRLEKDYFRNIFYFTIIFSIFTSVLTVLYYPKNSYLSHMAYTMGASGVIAGLLGFTPIFLFVYLSDGDRNNLLKINTSVLFIFYGMLFFIVTYVQNILWKLLAILVYFGIFIWSFKTLKQAFFVFMRKKYLEKIVMILILVIFFIMTPSLFSKQVLIGNAAIDFLIHYLGVCLGALFSYVYFLTRHEIKLELK